MARNTRRSNGMKKLQPAVMQMEFVVPEGTSYIDINLAASLVNRRAYKQENTNFAIASFEFLGSGSGSVAIGKLPETWVAHNAYTKARALWNEMNDQVLDTNEGIQGRYADFKVYLDENMVSQTIQTANNPGGRILTPTSSSGWTQANFDESAAPKANWDWSTIQVPNDPASGVTTEYTLHMIGGASVAPASMGVIHGYGLSRSRPQLEEPNTPGALATGDWMTALFDDGEQLEELKTDLIDDNDRPPYAVGSPGGNSEFYPGGNSEFESLQVHGFCSYTGTTISGKNVIQGGMFGLGMCKIQNDTGSTLNLLIHYVPGTHRGYLCEELA